MTSFFRSLSRSSCEEEFLEVVQKMVSSGDLEQPGNGGMTPLHLACLKKYQRACRTLLQYGANPNARLKGGHTPLMTAADYNAVECLVLLLQSGAKVNARNVRGDTALHMAAYRGYVDTLRQLITSGADPHVTNNFKLTPIEEAQSRDQIQCMNLLKQAVQGKPKTSYSVSVTQKPVGSNSGKYLPYSDSSHYCPVVSTNKKTDPNLYVTSTSATTESNEFQTIPATTSEMSFIECASSALSKTELISGPLSLNIPAETPNNEKDSMMSWYDSGLPPSLPTQASPEYPLSHLTSIVESSQKMHDTDHNSFHANIPAARIPNSAQLKASTMSSEMCQEHPTLCHNNEHVGIINNQRSFLNKLQCPPFHCSRHVDPQTVFNHSTEAVPVSETGQQVSHLVEQVGRLQGRFDVLEQKLERTENKLQELMGCVSEMNKNICHMQQVMHSQTCAVRDLQQIHSTRTYNNIHQVSEASIPIYTERLAADVHGMDRLHSRGTDDS